MARRSSTPISAPPMASFTPSTTCWYRSTRYLLPWRDVRVHPEQVVGIEARLERHQPFEVSAVGVAQARGVLGVVLVHVEPEGMRLDLRPVCLHPRAHRLAERRIFPAAEQEHVVGRGALRERGGTGLHARIRAATLRK